MGSKGSLVWVLLLSLLYSTSSFTFVTLPSPSLSSPRSFPTLLRVSGADKLPTPAESAEALRAYMVKSLANGITKDEEIKALKDELARQGRDGPSRLTALAKDTALETGDDNETLRARVAAYQTFIER